MHAAADVDKPPRKRRFRTVGLPGAATIVGPEALEEDGARLELRCLLPGPRVYSGDGRKGIR
jgi:hypothetical protein